jgi:hypothetical protein
MIEGRAHRFARRRMQGRRGVMVKVNTHARHERKSAISATYRVERTGNPPAPSAGNPKGLQSNGAYVLEGPPGSSGIAEPGLGSRPLRLIATLLLGAARLPKSSEPQMPLMGARNTRNVGRIARKIRLIGWVID